MKIVFYGIIKQGKVKLDLAEKWLVYLSGLEGQRIELTLQKERHARTLSQNSLYWLFLNFIGQELGYDAEELHATFKAMFLVDRSRELPIVRSTTSLTTIEFSDYLDKITRKVAEMGVVLPDPSKVSV